MISNHVAKPSKKQITMKQYELEKKFQQNKTKVCAQISNEQK